MITKLAWRNIWFKPLNTILSIILLTSSVAIITVLILLEKQFEEKFNSNIDGIDLVMGAQGSPLQLILSSVYQVDAPTGNISFDSAKIWMQNPMVKRAIPLAFGDNYKGFKIVGTTSEYLEKYGAVISEGKVFEKNFEVVVGSEAAQKLNLGIGDEFFGTHGSEEEGEVHEHYAYKVVGIASATGRVVDNLIISNIPSVWQMHGTHEEEAHRHEENLAHGEAGHIHEEGDEHEHHIDEESDMTIDEPGMEITSVLLQMRNPMAKLTWQRIIPQNTKMQAASPAIEINRLFTLFGVGIDALRYLAYGIMLISGISIFIALFNTLKERKNEFALLRVNGAGRRQLLKLVLIESLLLCVLGFIFGTILGRIGLMLISRSSESDFKLSFNPYEFIWDKEGWLLVLTLLVGVIAALIPAIKAYTLNISKTLAYA
ncbi:FtsX-like permease family protein [Flavobacterium sp. NRK F10]|uniref:ABC transporter permease n=1 Tax=Flavobacterium sp. NRK F10 TaxID=2954931 RepID=UPI002090CFA4|nr:FtsX-like permease family protein [Flavobacterium sp. NRK F10]MCO6174301.1 FtsX-like permease family protein [Flavobacterium sp. NRK F10]